MSDHFTFIPVHFAFAVSSSQWINKLGKDSCQSKLQYVPCYFQGRSCYSKEKTMDKEIEDKEENDMTITLFQEMFRIPKQEDIDKLVQGKTN